MTTRPISTPQLYALLTGAVLVALGIIGFFYESKFTSDEAVRDEVFGWFAVNGWYNTLYIVVGALGLLAVPSAMYSRAYSLAAGIVFVALTIIGFSIGSGDSIFSILPVNTGGNVLHLVIAVLGFLAFAGSYSTMMGKTPPATKPPAASSGT